jgi:2-keto-4-pentenoate hydratase
MNSAPQRVAEMLIAARRGGAKLQADDVEALISGLGACYEIQAIVTEAFGPAGAFKTARKPGQPTIMAPIYQSDIAASPACFSSGRFSVIGIELEVGFVVGKQLPAPDASEFKRRTAECISALPCIEIVDTRLVSIGEASPLVRLADNQLNGGLVVGEPVADWHGLDLNTMKFHLDLGTGKLMEGVADVPGGNAFGNFCALARMIGSHCGGLQPGSIVITGSLNGMPFVESGSRVRGHIEGLGSVEVEFDS